MYYLFPTFLTQMQLAIVPHDCTTQLILRLAHCLSSDAFDPNPVGGEAIHCSVVDVELSAAKVSPIAQIQKEVFLNKCFLSQAFMGAGSVLPVLPIDALTCFSA